MDYRLWEVLQDAKDKGLAKASSSRLFILHFSDPRSHWVHRKSQYYQGGMRCCLMSLLLKCLMICSKILSYFPTSTYDLNPKPNSDLPILSIRRHWVSHVISLCQTLISSVSPMGSRSHRDGLANSLLPIAMILVLPSYAIGPTEFAWPTLCFTYYPNRSHRVWVIGQTEMRLYPNPSTSVPPSWSCRYHRNA